MITKLKMIALIFLVGFFFSACVNSTPIAVANRPNAWAQPIELAGLPNLFRISGNLYRSAQPTAAGFSNALVVLGVMTDINLFAGHPDKNSLPSEITEVYIPAHPYHPEFEDAIVILKAIKAAPGPVLIHCQHGSDRTGWSCALFRIVFENWTKEAAIDEMLHGGYGFHGIWGDLPKWIRKVDIQKLKKEAGI